MTDTTVSTTDSTTRAMLNALEVIARKAGAAIMEIYESGDFTVGKRVTVDVIYEEKYIATFVTELLSHSKTS